MPNKPEPMPPLESTPLAHEPRDANVKAIAWVALLFILVGALTLTALYFYFSGNVKFKPVPRPILAAKKSDIASHRDLVLFEQQEENKLNSYGWTDREHGVVRIPIERAMELLVERGLPVRSAPSKNEKSPLELQRERAGEK